MFAFSFVNMQTNPLVSNSLLNTLLKYEPQLADEFADFVSQKLYSGSENLVDDVKNFFNQKGFYLNYSEALQIINGLNEFVHYTSTGQSLLSCSHDIPSSLLPVLSGEVVLSKDSFPQEEIGLIQDLLLAHGYSIDDHNGQDRGYFGNETENAVKDFQQQNGLTVDGVVGNQTLAALLGLTQQKVKQPAQPKKERNQMPIKEEDWAINTNNKEEVGELQDMLRSLNHFIDDKDGKYRGVYGEQTKSAVEQFQKIMGLKATGRVDKLTLQTLTQVTSTYQIPEGFDVKTGPYGAALIYNLSPQIESVFPIVVETWKEFNLPTPVITSGNDGTHTSAASKHYINQAIDIRGNNVSDATLEKLEKTLKQKLGSDYDVDAEFFTDPLKDHLHIEYDPD